MKAVSALVKLSTFLLISKIVNFWNSVYIIDIGKCIKVSPISSFKANFIFHRKCPSNCPFFVFWPWRLTDIVLLEIIVFFLWRNYQYRCRYQNYQGTNINIRKNSYCRPLYWKVWRITLDWANLARERMALYTRWVVRHANIIENIF